MSVYTAVDAVEKKLGGMSGKNVDPQKYRAQNEKLTDKIRGFLEKATGKKVCVCVYWREKKLRIDMNEDGGLTIFVVVV